MTARPPCPHSSADPRLCPDCRAERLGPVPVDDADDADEVALALADVVAPDRHIEPGQVDYALAAAADLHRVLGAAGYVVLRQDDARKLLQAAHSKDRPDPAVLLRVSEALAEAPRLRLIGANAVPPDSLERDHDGGNSTPLNNPPTG
ncbi:hypothetical protein [Nonomuraea sediminis]|uniref:hypothetical protein n=1 Tax=Nonomuraea sediminis TaxID=2835864 RepID=UPI001BDC5A52|nr:hypothetical protein [Nonomuraea sediminis]